MTPQQPVKPTAARADVTAVIYGDAPQRVSAALRRALDVQTVAPAGRLVASRLADAARAAADTETAWVWLLDGWTVPAPGALAGLLAVAEEVPEPVLVASKVLDEQGRVYCDSSLRHEVFEKERSVAAAERRLVHLRTAQHGSVLVRVCALRTSRAPRADLPVSVDMLEWSARLLRSREDSGYLLPTSVAVRYAGQARGSAWLGRARVLKGSAWTPIEKLWEAFLLGQAAVETIRGPLRDAQRSARPTAAHRAGRGE